MKAIELMREKFEQLPEITGILQDGFGFNSEINQYFHPDIENHRLGCAFLMGAWTVWQEQQKKIDEQQKLVDAVQALVDRWKAYKGLDIKEIGLRNCAKELERAIKGDDQWPH